MRSSFLREGVEAAEATFGVATDALIDRSMGRRPLVAPPPGWAPVGVMTAVARAMPRRMHERLADVPLVSSPPEKWTPQQGDGYRGWDRFRNRLVAKGGIGRAEQLVRRSLLRVPLSRPKMRYELRQSVARGPDATRDFLQRVASNPRRAATLVSLDLDPMVVAAAIGPRAMAAVASGQAVPQNSNLARLCDAMVRRDRARMNDLRHADAGPAGGRLAEARRDSLLGDEAEAFVNRAWDGSEAPELSLGQGPIGIDAAQPNGFYQTWQRLRTGEMPPDGIPEQVIDRIDQIRSGEYEPQPQGWGDVVDDYADLGGPEPIDPDAPDAAAEPARPAPAPRPQEPPAAAPGMDDPIAARPAVHPESNHNPQGLRTSRNDDGDLVYLTPFGARGFLPVDAPPPRPADFDLTLADAPELRYAAGQEARFLLARSGADGSQRWHLQDDPEIDHAYVAADGRVEVAFHAEAVPTAEAARRALGEVQARREGRVDHPAQPAVPRPGQPPVPPAERPRPPEDEEAPVYGMGDPVPDRPAAHPRSHVAPGAPGAAAPVLRVHRAGAPARLPAPGAAAPLVVHPVVVHPGQEHKFTLESNGSGRVWKANGDPEVESITVREDGSYDVRFRDGAVPTPEVAQWAASQVHERLQRQQDRDRPDPINVRPPEPVAPEPVAPEAPAPESPAPEPAAAEPAAPGLDPPSAAPEPSVQALPTTADSVDRSVPEPSPQLHAAARARADAEAREQLDPAGVPDSPEALASGDWSRTESGALVHRTAAVDPAAELGKDAIVGPGCEVEAGAVVGPRAYLLETSVAPGAAVGADGVLNFAQVAENASLGDSSVLEGAQVGEWARVDSHAYLGQQVNLGKDARVGEGACIGPHSPEEAATEPTPPGSARRTFVRDSACVGAGAVVARGADNFSLAEVGRDALVESDVRVHSKAHVGDGAVVRAGADVQLGASVPAGAEAAGAVERSSDSPLVTPPGVQRIIDDRGTRLRGPEAASPAPSQPDPSPAPPAEPESAAPVPSEPRGAADPDRAWDDPERIDQRQVQQAENPDLPPGASAPGPASPPSPPAEPSAAPVDDLAAPTAVDASAAHPPVEVPAGAEDPDRYWADGHASEGPDDDASTRKPEPSGRSQALSMDIPESMLTAPYNKKTIKSGEAPDPDAPVPEGPDFVSMGNGRWDVVGDPLVSHLTELPDGGYRVTFHPGVKPDPTAAVEMSSKAHEHLMDQDVADRQRGVDEDHLAASVSATLSREVADGHAPCDEDRSRGGSNEPVLVEVLDSGSPPRTGATPLSDLSGQAVRAWMRDQDPEVFTPEFATAEQIAAAGGRLKPDAKGVDIVRHFSRDLQPFGQDGKIDPQAKPVTVTASERLTVYNVGRAVALEPAGARQALVRDDARTPPAPPASVRDVAAASGAEVVDDPRARLGYSAKSGKINVSDARAERARLTHAQVNGKVLYAAAVARLTADGVPADHARATAYLAAERLASKLRAPYKPVKLEQPHRVALAQPARPEVRGAGHPACRRACPGPGSRRRRAQPRAGAPRPGAPAARGPAASRAARRAALARPLRSCLRCRVCLPLC